MARDHHWHRWHRDRIDGGDVLAGALILGGIAAIASTASRQDRDQREPAPPPPPAPVEDDRQGYVDGAADRDVGSDRDQGLDRAADLCAKAVDSERNRVDFVDNVTPEQGGWAVSGALVGGSGFSCRVGSDGQVRDVNVGGPRAEADARDDKGDDDAPPGEDDRPVWHGDQPQPQGQPEPQDDGRYDTSQAPDFGQSA